MRPAIKNPSLQNRAHVNGGAINQDKQIHSVNELCIGSAGIVVAFNQPCHTFIMEPCKCPIDTGITSCPDCSIRIVRQAGSMTFRVELDDHQHTGVRKLCASTPVEMAW